MKIKLKKDQKKLQLLKAIASTDKAVSEKAQESLAAFVGPVIQQVLDIYASSAFLYGDNKIEYDKGTNPSIPLDLFDGNEEGLITGWSQSIAGGLPTNLVSGLEEFRFTTARLDTAVAFLKQYAEDARLDVISKGMNRMLQELRVKREFQAWSPVLLGLAEAVTGGNQHIIDAGEAGVFKLDDLNKLITKVKRFRNSWVGGTPASSVGRGITDIVISPEITEQIRAFAYQPMSTRGVTVGAGDTDKTLSGIPLTDKMRDDIYSSVGIPSMFGIPFVELNELGVGQAYTKLFDSLYTPGGGDVTFDSATQDIVLGVDRSVDAFVQANEMNGSNDSSVFVDVDDQFVKRSEKFGWFGYVKESYFVLDKKALCGVVV